MKQLHTSVTDYKLSNTQIQEFPKRNHRLDGDTRTKTTSGKVKNIKGRYKGHENGVRIRINVLNVGNAEPLAGALVPQLHCSLGKVQMARQADGQVWE